MTAAASTIRIQLNKPHPAQAEIDKCESRFIVAVCGRRFGKTSSIVRKRIRPLLGGMPCAYFAPNYKMLQEFWRQTKSILAPITTHVSKQEHRLEFLGGGSLTMWSLDNPDSARGQKYACADVDEAAMISELEEAWNAVIRPTLTDYEGAAAFWSTPKGLNYFHTLYSRGLDAQFANWASFRFPTSANPFINPSEIEAAKAELPEDVFRQEYLAEFIQGEGAVFRNITANLTDAPTTPKDHQKHVLVAGVDWGAVNDFTAISIVCETCQREVHLDRFNKIEWDFQRARLLNALNEWDVRLTVAEENSIGSPNLEALQKTSTRSIIGFQTTAQSKPPLIQSLALAFEQNEVKWIADAIARRELEAYEATRNATTNRIQYSAPSGFHDDTVIARALARHAMEERKRHSWTQTRIRIR
ncbi:MAG: hypothetical protein E6Q97_30995 [Desulfurellales bacterium]|nr:MAG: hypothetical protein E6Q97_30995 [Desulfurellales bacterium]